MNKQNSTKKQRNQHLCSYHIYRIYKQATCWSTSVDIESPIRDPAEHKQPKNDQDQSLRYRSGHDQGSAARD